MRIGETGLPAARGVVAPQSGKTEVQGSRACRAMEMLVARRRKFHASEGALRVGSGFREPLRGRHSRGRSREAEVAIQYG